VTKCIIPRQALDSVLNRMAEVQVGSFKSANGSCRNMAATWGRRCADWYQLTVVQRETGAGRRVMRRWTGQGQGPEDEGTPGGRRDEVD
jgi:hypothetical protein